jgi:hypothetical protein
MRNERPRKRVLRAILLAIAAIVIVTACEPIYTQAAVDYKAETPDSRPWWCDSTGGVGHGGHGGHDPYAGMTKGELSWDDCYTNSIYFDVLLDWAQQWTSEGVAEDAGFFQVVPYATGMGTHHLNPNASTFDDVFNPAQPEFIMFDGDGRNAKLTGFAWWVKSEGGPPEGFAGNNDWWHQHPHVCLSPSGTWWGQGDTREACEGRGGTFLPNHDMWMTHAWVLPNWELQFDVFQNHHPCITGGGTITDPNDDCWMEAIHGGDH